MLHTYVSATKDYLDSQDSTINKNTPHEKNKWKKIKSKQSFVNHHNIHKNALFQKYLVQNPIQQTKDTPH